MEQHQPNIEKNVCTGNEIFETEKELLEIKNGLGKIDESKLSTEQKSTLLKIKERLFKATRKLFRTVEWVTVICAVFAVGNYERTHSGLEVINNPDGTNEYKHEDTRTTHLLNVLSGREKFNEQDMKIEYNGLIKEVVKQKGGVLSKNIEDMSISELDTAGAKYFREIDTAYKPGDLVKNFYDELKSINMGDKTLQEIKSNKNIYELVWQMEKECGNPRIRFVSENIDFTPVSNFKGSEHYDPINNTIYISPWDMIPHIETKIGGYKADVGIIPEMSHAKQFNDNEVGSFVGSAIDVIGVLRRGGFDTENITEEYKKLYFKPGSFEHDAHNVIEPYLRKKYQIFISK